jgi:hypothetical protein
LITGRLRHTDETSSLGIVILADSTQRLNFELRALELADRELRRDVFGSQQRCCGEGSNGHGEEAAGGCRAQSARDKRSHGYYCIVCM